jgi:hypothetical protein
MAGRARAMGATGRGAFGSFGYQLFRIDTFLFILTYVYICALALGSTQPLTEMSTRNLKK